MRAELGHSSEVSARLMPLASRMVFEIYKMVGPRSAILCDPDSKATQFTFSQPVNVDRLIPFDLAALEVPVAEPPAVRLRLREHQGGAWKHGDITHQSGTGKVWISMDDGTADWYELANFEHEWVRSSPAAPAAGAALLRLSTACG